MDAIWITAMRTAHKSAVKMTTHNTAANPTLQICIKMSPLIKIVWVVTTILPKICGRFACDIWQVCQFSSWLAPHTLFTVMYSCLPVYCHYMITPVIMHFKPI